MSSAYALFRDTVAWQASAGAEAYPGVPNLGAASTITVRDLGLRRVRFAEDVLERRVYWLLPADAVKPNDRLAGARVDRVDPARDAVGNVVYQVAYVEA